MKGELKGFNYELINDLYMRWYNERDPFMQRKRKDDIKNRISPYELLMYSSKYCLSFKIFEDIYSLADLFRTLEEMQRQGQDISSFTNQPLVVRSIEDIQILNQFARQGVSPEIGDFALKFNGDNIFKYGDVKGIGKNFPYACVNLIDLQLIEQMLKSNKDYKGIPIIITIDNIGELSLEKLSAIEKCFDIAGIKVVEKDIGRYSHQGEQRPINLRTYKRIRTIVDDEIIGKLYVDPNTNKKSEDYQLAVQIIDKIVGRIEYDFEAAKKERFSDEVANASGLMGLLSGKSICKGYSEIFRNVFSCVGGESKVIDGIMNGEPHSWNIVKIGDKWFQMDITTSRKVIIEGKPSGNLFMSDMAFFGDRRKVTFDKGLEIKGRNIESTVVIGGREKPYSLNNYQCGEYIPPTLTSILIAKSRLYDETYKKEGNSIDYKGAVPYVGSSVEKIRSSLKTIRGIEH